MSVKQLFILVRVSKHRRKNKYSPVFFLEHLVYRTFWCQHDGILCRFYGTRSLKVALNHHLVARTHSCKGDFRSALQSEKEAYAIYKQLVRCFACATGANG